VADIISDDGDSIKKEVAEVKPQMQEEERQTGTVSWSIYGKYLDYAGGIFWAPVFVLAIVATQAAQGTFGLVGLILDVFLTYMTRLISGKLAVPRILDIAKYQRFQSRRIHGRLRWSWCVKIRFRNGEALDAILQALRNLRCRFLLTLSLRTWLSIFVLLFY